MIVHDRTRLTGRLHTFTAGLDGLAQIVVKPPAARPARELREWRR